MQSVTFINLIFLPSIAELEPDMGLYTLQKVNVHIVPLFCLFRFPTLSFPLLRDLE